MNTSKLVPVKSSEIIYRAITKSDWIDNYVVLRSAFTLRKNEKYLSVDRLGERHESIIFDKYRNTFRRLFGATKLNVSDCIDVGVEVYEIGKKDDKYYSGIFYPDEPDLMMSIADDLADNAEFVSIHFEITIMAR